MVVLKDSGNGSCHQGLAETHHVADQNTTPFVQMVGGNLHGRDLEIEQHIGEIAGKTEFGEARAGLLGQMVGNFQVDVVRRRQLCPCPTLFDDLDQFLGNVPAEVIIPAFLEPLRKFLAGVLIENVDIQFALAAKAQRRSGCCSPGIRPWELIGSGRKSR